MDNQQERSLAWLAGIIDGEGTITFQTTIRGNNCLCVTPFVTVTNSDDKITQEVAAIFESLIRERKTGTVFVHNMAMNTSLIGFTSNKQCRNVRVNGEATRPILEALLPYLRSEKRRNAEIVLEYLDSRKKSLFIRTSANAIRRGGYRQSEIDLVVSLRTHKRAKSSETLRSASNIVG